VLSSAVMVEGVLKEVCHVNGNKTGHEEDPKVMRSQRIVPGPVWLLSHGLVIPIGTTQDHEDYARP